MNKCVLPGWRDSSPSTTRGRAHSARRRALRDNLETVPIDGDTADAAVVEGILADTYEFSEGTTPPTSSCSRI